MAKSLHKKWEQRMTRAQKAKEEWEDQFQIQMLLDYFEGKQNPGYPEEEWITVNKFYSHLQAQLPMLYGMDPYFYVKLKKSYSPDPNTIAKYELMGRGRQAMLNYLKKELNVKSHARLGIQDAHFSFGVLKTRRASDEEDHPKAGEPMLTESGKEMVDENGVVMTYPETRPVNERYEYDRIHPKDFIFGADSGTLEKNWDFVAQKITMTKAEALDDKRFKKSVVRNARGHTKKEDDPDEKKGIFKAGRLSVDDDEVYLDFWEIYDLKAKEWLFYLEDADDLPMNPRGLPPGVKNHPYSILRFVLRDDSPYPIPPMYAGLDPQKEYNLSRSQTLTHRKRFNRKYEVNVNHLEDPDSDLTALEVGDDGAIVRVVAHAVDPINDAPLDQQRYSELALLNNDLNELLGSPDGARGIAAADSATEAGLLDRRLEVKEGDRMSLVVDWILESAEKLDCLVQVHIDRDEAVKVTGPEGEAWMDVKQTDYSEIDGQYEYSVNVGATQPRLPDIERSQWIAFLSQVVVPFPQILTAPPIMKRVAEMFHIEDDAAVEALRQLGMQMMQGQLPMPGNTGGGPSDNPVAAVIGQAMGASGGNANGGGA